MTAHALQNQEESSYSLVHHAKAMRQAYWELNLSLNAEARKTHPEYPKLLGNLMGAIVLRAFAAELQLKALSELETGTPGRGHDLHKLFRQLSKHTRTEIERGFLDVVPVLVTNPDTSITAEQVYRRHRKDFENWRYIYEVPGSMSIEWAYLDCAITAIELRFFQD